MKADQQPAAAGPSEYEEAYHRVRFPFDDRRNGVWREVVRYLQPRYVPTNGVVLDLGAGYCDFINNVQAREKHAVDLFTRLPEFAAKGVNVHVQSCTSLPFADESIDVTFASNLFEHLSREDLATVAAELHRVLRPGGRLLALQPNFRYCVGTYFDDYTHLQVFTHESLRDFLEVAGFRAVAVVPRLLPVNMKSKLPVPVPGLNLLVRMYLRSPVRPLAAQMLLVVEKP
ncbi:MAG: class I SAM-dependent methyltransferase [Longimicrobiales bacterium]